METKSGRIIQIIFLILSFAVARLPASPAAKPIKPSSDSGTAVLTLPNFTIADFAWIYEPNDDPEEDDRRCEVQWLAEIVSDGAAFEGECEFGLYLSPDPNITTGDPLVMEDSFEFGRSGRFYRQSPLLGLYQNAPPLDPGKKHYLGIIVDHHGRIDEADEEDNSAVQSQKIIIECISDLSVSSRQVSFDPETCLLDARAYVSNNAPMHNYLADYSVGLYLSEDKQITGDDLRIGSEEMFWVPDANLGEFADAQVDISNLLADPDFDGNKSYYVGWMVDDRDVIEEFDESNNTAVSSDALVRCSPPLPNLTLDLDHSGFEFDAVACRLTLNARVINTGDERAPESRLGYYLSTDNSVRTDDFFIGSSQARGLAPGDFSDETFSVRIDTLTLEPPFDNYGTYFAGWIVDDRGRIDESNEKDNRFAIDETITCSRTTPTASLSLFAPDSIACGEHFVAPVVVGDSDPVEDLFRLRLQLSYAAEFIDLVGIVYSDPAEGSANLFGEDLVVHTDSVDHSSGTVTLDLSRKAGQGGVDGSGAIAWLRFEVAAADAELQLPWSFSNLSANDPTGNEIELVPDDTLTALVCGCVVWPGDANNDGTVNAADVLPLGLHYGTSGTVRARASNSWTAQQTDCWEPEPATYADCDGNGAVDVADVLPIGLNFGKTHSLSSVLSFSLPQPTPQSQVDGQTGTIIPIVTEHSEENVKITIQLAGIHNLHGLAFDLHYDLDGAPLEVTVVPFLGPDCLFISDHNAAGKSLSVGMSRKAGQGGVSGDLTVAKIDMKVSGKFINLPITVELRNIVAMDASGNAIGLSSESGPPVLSDTRGGADGMQQTFVLFQNYPNPFNAETVIPFHLPRRSNVEIEIYDVLGNEVKALLDENRPAGIHLLTWDGRDNSGRAQPSGIHLCRLKIGEFTTVRKMTLIK